MDPLLARQSLVSKDKGKGEGWEKNNIISLKHNVQVSGQHLGWNSVQVIVNN